MRSVNQNHHLYVATGVSAVDETKALGTIYPYISGDSPMDKDLYFKYKGHDGVVRSDFIPLNQITYIKYIPADEQKTPLKKVKVTLDSSINSGAPVVGEDYILNIAFQQFYGLSPEDTYVKTVAVHVTSATNTASTFYAAMVDELNAAFAREVGASANTNPYLTFTAANDGITIEEKPQAWSLGKWEDESLMFEVFPSTIYVGGAEVEWGTATPVDPTTFVPNSKKMADLEWFTFGERADFYRGMGYPNNFDFRPMVVSSDATGYDALEIHFAYQGTCEDIQKSEKDITIIAKASDEYVQTLKTLLEGQNYLNMTIPTAGK